MSILTLAAVISSTAVITCLLTWPFTYWLGYRNGKHDGREEVIEGIRSIEEEVER